MKRSTNKERTITETPPLNGKKKTTAGLNQTCSPETRPLI